MRARLPSPPGKPDQDADRAHRRHAERHEPKHEAERRRPLSVVEHVDGFRDALPGEALPDRVTPG